VINVYTECDNNGSRTDIIIRVEKENGNYKTNFSYEATFYKKIDLKSSCSLYSFLQLHCITRHLVLLFIQVSIIHKNSIL